MRRHRYAHRRNAPCALILYHDQGSVPEYYSAKLYMSIPVEYIPIELSAGDEVQVSMTTYGGEVVKTFSF